VLKEFLQDAKRFIITLRFSILLVFIILFSATMLLLISYSYHRASKTMILVANKIMEHVSANIVKEINNNIRDAMEESSFSAKIAERNIINVNIFSELIPYLYELAKSYVFIQSFFWSDQSGNFIVAEKDLNNTLRVRSIIRDPKNNTLPGVYYDYNNKIIPAIQAPQFDYDPRKKIYYSMVQTARSTICTDIYTFQPSGILGITIASPVFDKNKSLQGVFGMGIRLDYFSKFLANERVGQNGVAFVTKSDGTLIAFPNLQQGYSQNQLLNISSVPIPWVVKSFDIYQKEGKQEFIFNYKGKNYLARYQFISYCSQKRWLIGIVVPEDDFVSELRKESITNIFFGLGILLVGILVVSSLVTQVVRPLKNVLIETEKIKHFELDDEVNIKSHIKEVSILAAAIQSMKNGLKAFKRYVPASLVRKLIEENQAANIGGEKRQLTIFFSDIENFTSLAEKTDPNELLKRLCGYFNIMSNIIADQQGTIDKFIGDSVMAFWGAPKSVETPEEKAADAALLCIEEIERLNLFKTRIGIHTGEALVGNIGSNERMNYTVIGDAVNVANRLESTNKIYGTKILVSEAVYEKIKDKFILRRVDRVTMKGKSESHVVYELIGRKNTPNKNS
jgi:adenylate cyclase